MNFLRSLKLGAFFVFLCFSSVLAMESVPAFPSLDSIESIKVQLAKYLIRIETADGRLVHDGIRTAVGVRSLLDMFSAPVSLPEIKERQEILRELVILNSQDFADLSAFLKKIAVIWQELLVLSNEVEQLRLDLEKRQPSLSKIDFDPWMFFTFMALHSMWSSQSGMAFTSFVGLSMLVSAFDQYFLNSFVSSRASYAYIFSAIAGILFKEKDALLCAGNSIFSMDNNGATKLFNANVCAGQELLTCAGDGSVYCTGAAGTNIMPISGQVPKWSLAPYLPSVVKSVASYVGKAGNLFFVGNGLLRYSTLSKRIAYKKVQSNLIDNNKKREELSRQFIILLNDLVDLIKQKNLKISKIIALDKEAAFGVKIHNLAKLDMFIGLASLIRESNQEVSGSTKFKIGFVDFIKPNQNKNRFEMSIKNICHFFKFKPEDEYKTATVFVESYIFPELSFVVSEDNKFFANSKDVSQINFLTDFLNQIYAQMLLAHALGIVWGQSAQITFIDMNRLSFVSSHDKMVHQIIFPR